MRQASVGGHVCDKHLSVGTYATSICRWVPMRRASVGGRLCDVHLPVGDYVTCICRLATM